MKGLVFLVALIFSLTINVKAILFMASCLALIYALEWFYNSMKGHLQYAGWD
jgi:hypothetical protein